MLCGGERKLYGRALLAQTAENMMGVTNYYRLKKTPCPWRRGRRPAGSHPFSASHKTLQTIHVTLVQEHPPCWRRVHESSDRCCPCNAIQGLTGHSSLSKTKYGLAHFAQNVNSAIQLAVVRIFH